LVFTGTLGGGYHKFDSLLIENLDTGSRITKHYPDTVLYLLITGNENIPGSGSPALSQNFPNPYTEKTSFTVFIPSGDQVTLKIMDMAGRTILIHREYLPPGNHLYSFSGGGESMYLAVLMTSSSTRSVKMLRRGASGNKPPALEYMGEVATVQRSARNLGIFEFNTGDNLRLTGFMTDTRGTVITDTITDAPLQSTTYTFGFKKVSRILILMYHKLTDNAPADEYDRNTADFENDLIYLRDNNYQVISMDDLPGISAGTMILESDAVIITFDDGYESNYSMAYPLLSSYGMPATFFLVTEWIGTEGFMTWSEVWTMSQDEDSGGRTPFVMGSHTSSHPYLEESEPDFPSHEDWLNFLNTELGDSGTWITDVTGQATIFMSLPYGDGVNNEDIINAAKANGYSGIRSSVWNSIDPSEMNLYSLPSLPVLSDTPINSIDEYFSR
jgi:peptidoglycan/xylan/chitin deacetylase (PgdA/CDA1 family)